MLVETIERIAEILAVLLFSVVAGGSVTLLIVAISSGFVR